uniref:Uncharacterized protein n=1 Tax=Oryza brachyantha TaxID=4533 RepID=J3MX45_ORYBR
MGNCQAAEAAAVVIQHPGGKVERLGRPPPPPVMRTNPGHYVALVILRISADKAAAGDAPAAAAASAGAGGKDKPAAGGGGGGGAKITRVKLLKPKDTLLLGQVYRLITSQEVTKALRARKNEKMRRCEAIRQQHEQLRRGDPLADVAEEEESACDDQTRTTLLVLKMFRVPLGGPGDASPDQAAVHGVPVELQRASPSSRSDATPRTCGIVGASRSGGASTAVVLGFSAAVLQAARGVSLNLEEQS